MVRKAALFAALTTLCAVSAVALAAATPAGADNDPRILAVYESDSFVEETGERQPPTVVYESYEAAQELGAGLSEDASWFLVTEEGVEEGPFPNRPDGGFPDSAGPGGMACLLGVDVPYKISFTLLLAHWSLVCNAVTAFTVQSCIWRTDGRRMGCNNLTGHLPRPGAAAQGNTLTSCSPGTWTYYHRVEAYIVGLQRILPGQSHFRTYFC